LGKQIDRDRLASYGMPSKLIDTFDRMAKRGAFDVEPPDELLDRTLDACLALVEEEQSGPLVFPGRNYDWLFRSAVRSGIVGAKPSVIHLRHHGLCPLTMWDSNEFSGMRTICTRLAEPGGSAPLKIEVLRDPRSYTKSEYETLCRQYEEDPCDIVWVPHSAVSELGVQDMIVAEPIGVFSLRERPENPRIAIDLYLESQQPDPEAIAETKRTLLNLESVSVKRGRVLESRFEKCFVSPQGVKEAIAETFEVNGW
jgi:hypothetical protein